MEQEVAAYLAVTAGQVEPLYQLEKAGALKDGDQRMIAFAAVRLAAGAAETRNLVVEAWRASPSLVVGWRPVTVDDVVSGKVIGTTRYHDILASVARLEIGYTWYGKSWQRTHVNTACKLLLMSHAFDELGAAVVGWRTDNFNYASQRAIERLGAKRDGVLRHHAMRRDGTVRDTVMYSVIAGEWPEVRDHLTYQLNRHAD